MENYMVLGILGYYAMEDVKKKKITVTYLPLLAIIGICMHLYHQYNSILNILGGILLGIGILGLSFITRGSIGIGDGLVLAVTGIYLGAAKNLELFMTGLLLAAAWSLGLLILCRKKRKFEIPFIPFLLAGYIMVLLGVG